MGKTFIRSTVGLAEGWIPIHKYWKDPSLANREAVRQFVTPEAIKWQYTHGVKDLARVAPDTYLLDAALPARPGNVEIQLDLFLDYADNMAKYPQFQAYFRKRRPPILAVWGKNDPFFLNAGVVVPRRRYIHPLGAQAPHHLQKGSSCRNH